MLRDGVVVDTGPLDELLDRCDELRHLWTGADTQTSLSDLDGYTARTRAALERRLRG